MRAPSYICRCLLLLSLLFSSLLPSAALFSGEQELPPLVYVPLQDDGWQVNLLDVRLNIDYARWLEVLREIQELRRPSGPERPPVEVSLESLHFSGRVEDASAHLRVQGRIQALSERWSQISLPGNWHLSSLVLDQEGVALQPQSQTLQIHLPSAGHYSFHGDLAVPVQSQGRSRSLELSLPGQGAAQIEIDLPVAEAEFSTEPRLPFQQSAIDGGTRVRISAGNARRVQLRWQAPEPRPSAEALIIAQTHQHLLVDQRRLQWQMAAELDVLRQEVQHIRLQLPPQAQVLRVENEHVRNWQVEDSQLLIELESAQRGKLTIALVLERSLPDLAIGEEYHFDLDWIHFPGAIRSAGSLALLSVPGMALQVLDAAGLTQINPQEALLGRNQQAQLAYRLHAPAPQQQLQIRRLAPELGVEVQQLVRLGVDEDLISCLLGLEVRGSGVFHLRLRVPEHWRWLSHQGMQVDEVRQGEAEAGWKFVDIELRNQLLGRQQITLHFSTPGSLEQGSDLQMLELVEAQQSSGALLVAAPPSWALASSEMQGMVPTSLSRLQEEAAMRPLLRHLDANMLASLSFALRELPARVLIESSPRPRELVVQQELRQLIGAGSSQSSLRWHGDIRYRAIETLHIEAPSSLDHLLRFRAANLAESRLLESDDAEDSGRSRWRLRFQGPQMGRLEIHANWSDSREQSLQPGQQEELLVPMLRILEATRERTAVALVREDDLELSLLEVLGPGLVAAPIGDLPPSLQGTGASLALIGSEPSPFRLRLLRHDILPLAEASISLAAYRAELAHDQRLRVRADLTLHNRGRPWILVHLPEDARLLEISVDGRSGRPSRREDGSLILPLSEQAATHHVAFFYEQQVDQSLGWWGQSHLQMPYFAGDGHHPLPVERSLVELYLPQSLRILGAGSDFDHPLLTASLTRSWWGDAAAQQPLLHRENTFSGMGMHLDPQGQRHVFWRANDGGVLRLSYIHRGLLHFLALLLIPTAAGLLILLRTRRQTLLATSLLSLLPLLLLPAPWYGLALAWNAAWFASLLIWQSYSLGLRFWRWRQARSLAETLPLPWQEDAAEIEADPQ